MMSKLVEIVGWCFVPEREEVQKAFKNIGCFNFGWRDEENNEMLFNIDKTIKEWHNDCGNIDRFMLVWSNTVQTELRWRRLPLIPLPPFAIVKWHNKTLKHRTSPFRPVGRLFARAYI